MLKSIQWDIYTIIIAALIPAVLLGAWGLTTWEDSRIHKQQCDVAETWLQESALLAPMFQNAGTMEDTTSWISGIEELNSPAAAGTMRHGILESARYNQKYYPDRSTSEPGVLNPKDGLYDRTINKGAENLIEHCPEVEQQLPKAFPMVFPEEGSN